MATDVLMPRLSDSMAEGTVLKWLVSEGGDVKRGEPLVEIETDKANMTYEADTDGTLIEVLASEGDTLPIGEVIARVGAAGEKPTSDGAKPAAEPKPADEGQRAEGAQPAERAADEPSGNGSRQVEPGELVGAPASGDRAAAGDRPAAAASESGEGAESGGRIKASPVARRMASEMEVELTRLQGSGPGGRIVKADIEAAARGEAKLKEERGGSQPEAAPAGRPQTAAAGESGAKGEVRIQELSRLQQTVSRRMAESKATAPDFQLRMQIDMSACVQLRAQLKQVSDPAPSFNDMVVKACAGALGRFPRVNGAYRDGRFELYSRVNVGVAVAAQDALVVPTVFDADRKSLGEISREARELISRVRDGSITPPELSGGTFTVSNLGMYGIASFTAIINSPQAAILAIGALTKQPVVDSDGEIVARDMMDVTLGGDHRILYGADGAEFLGNVRERLEQPLALLL